MINKDRKSQSDIIFNLANKETKQEQIEQVENPNENRYYNNISENKNSENPIRRFDTKNLEDFQIKEKYLEMKNS